MIRASLCAGLLVLPTLGLAEPSYRRVTGVAANDVLNVRAAPSASAADIGDLPHDARGIEVLEFEQSGKWARIGLAESDGWVSTRFLASDDIPMLGGTTVPQGLVCGGTEPFWALRLYDDNARYSHPEDGDTHFAVDSIVTAEGRLGSPALVSLSAEETKVIDATISGATCSDGMSDRVYGWTITMHLKSPGQRRFLTGCCHLPRD